MEDIWTKYGFLAILIILYGAIGNPKGNTLKYMWFLYCAGAAAIGMNLFNLNEDDNK